MDKVFKEKKSKLRSVQAQELRTLEKDLKKKKGNARDDLAEFIEETKRRHEKELEDLEKQSGIAVTTKTAKPSQPSKQAFYFPPCNWEELGKKRLEAEASKRGLGKSGNREDLVTKLTIFQAEQKKKVEDGLIDIKNVYREDKQTLERKGGNLDKEGDDEDGSNNTRSYTEAESPANSFKKRDHPHEDSIKKGVAARSSSSDGSSSSETDSEGDDDDDVPDILKVTGREGDSRGSQKRTTKQKYGRSGVDRSKNKNNNQKIMTEEEHQSKREGVMAQVLVKLLEKHPDGILVDNIGLELKKFKVTNFRPELLGYETTEEWILNQSPNILHYDAKHKRITPGRNRALPREHE